MPTIARRGRAALLLGALVLASCARNPVTGRNELSLVSEEQEIALGQQAAQQAEAQIGLVPDEALQQYVQRIGAALAAESERPGLPWRFRVVDDESPNAFALPGGFIYVTRGLLALMNSEAELAAVIGHEIGHVTAKHSVQAISRQQVAQVGLGLGAIFSPTVAQYGEIAAGGLQLLFLKYGRDAENQADDLGFKYARAENYAPAEMDDIFVSLAALQDAAGGSNTPTWLLTHPEPAERVRRMQQRIQSAGSTPNAKVGADALLARVNGLVFGANPRNGFFRGNVFYHPEMRFQLTFPQGWQMVNGAQAVQAVSPNQDAGMQLTLAQERDPATALRAFLSQQGVQAGQATQQSVNGVPAAASYFQAQTQQGTVTGIVAYFSHGGNTFQLLGYGPTERWPNNDPAVRGTLGSFAPVNDPAILNVQPVRLEVVRLDRPTTIAELARGSQVPAEQIAIINQASGPDATLPAGSFAKRVR